MSIDVSIPWGMLTKDPNKLGRYTDEIQSRITWDNIYERYGDKTLSFLHEYSFLVVKPETLARGLFPLLLNALNKNNFDVVNYSFAYLDFQTSVLIWKFQWNAASIDRINLSVFKSLRFKSIVLFLKYRTWNGSVPASAKLYDAKGSSKYREKVRPDQIRSVMGMSNRFLTYIHTPDEPSDFLREIGCIFSGSELLNFISDRKDISEVLNTIEENVVRHSLSFDEVSRALINEDRDCSGLVERYLNDKSKVKLSDLQVFKESSKDEYSIWDYITLAAEMIVHDCSGKQPIISTLSMPKALDEWKKFCI